MSDKLSETTKGKYCSSKIRKLKRKKMLLKASARYIKSKKK